VSPLDPGSYDRLVVTALGGHLPVDVREPGLLQHIVQLVSQHRPVAGVVVYRPPALALLAHQEEVDDVGAAIFIPVPDLEVEAPALGRVDYRGS
jgi:hypothetical protein